MARKTLPEFKDREDAARFFEAHDSADHVATITEPIEIDPELEELILAKQKKRQVTLRLNEWMIHASKTLGVRLGVPYQNLLKLWIAQGIHRTAQETRSDKKVRTANK